MPDDPVLDLIRFLWKQIQEQQAQLQAATERLAELERNSSPTPSGKDA